MRSGQRAQLITPVASRTRIPTPAATRLSFFLAIPALTAAGLLELGKSLGGGVGVGPTVIGTVIAFVVAYATIAWLLRFVAHHRISLFIPYRVAAGVGILVLLATGVIS